MLLTGYVSRAGVRTVWWICDDARWPCRLDMEGSAWVRQSPSRCSPKNCPTPLEWKSNIFSSSLFSFAFCMHNPCLNKPPPQRCVLCDLSGGQRHVYSCVWDRGIAAHLIGTLSTRASPNRYLLPTPTLDSFTLSVHGCNIHNSDGRDVFGLRSTCWLLLAN